MAAVDDYPEVRPEATGPIAQLVHSGQLAIGPWAILLDEFLCSGETSCATSRGALARARQLGGALPVGYLPGTGLRQASSMTRMTGEVTGAT